MDRSEDISPTLTRTGDKELRSRVRLFGNLLGEVLREHAGEDILRAVEALRKGYIRLRKEEDERLRARLTHITTRLGPDELTDVIRAFNLYFSLVNVAEEAFQHSERRKRLRKHDRLWRGS
ncbi:MAG: phosphoenolpyruvate carboxylase, partial [Gammaproteobacteria bacterium]|nr:phosphoenolpyruvate carboxylase [Gammaproteobacteria bacterium]